MKASKFQLIIPGFLGVILLVGIVMSGSTRVVAADLHPTNTPTNTPVPPTPTHTATVIHVATATNTPVPPTKTPTSATLQGRFTGGGSIFTSAGVRVTHGFELYCSLSQGPNNLEINWAGNRFHLDQLTSVSCSLVNGVPTITGTGTGTYNGQPGATITFTFNDAGEPGRNTDFASITIKVGSTTVLQASGLLDSGNQQFHPAK